MPRANPHALKTCPQCGAWLKTLDFSLAPESRGHACVKIKSHEMKIFLSTLTPNILTFFNDSIEDIIKELVIHEVIGLIVCHDKYDDKIIDGWHKLLCRIYNVNVIQSKDCSCPIDCFWRDIYS